MTHRFKIRVSDHGDVKVVAIAGRIDASAQIPLDECFKKSIKDRKFVVIDLSELTFIDSSGLSFILAARKDHQARYKSVSLYLHLVIPPGNVRKIFDATRLGKLFTIHGNLADALSAFPTARILFVESDETITQLVGPLLEANNYEVIYRNDIEKVRNPRNGSDDFDLVVVDIESEADRAEEIVRRFRDEFGVAAGILTGVPGLEISDAAFILEKPFDPVECLTHIQNHAGPN